MMEPYRGEKIDLVVGMESRGFIFSSPMAYQLGAGLVPVRKLGKLPAETMTVEYALEYGSNTLEIHATPSSRARRSSSSTTCWRPAAPSAARSSSSSGSRARSSGWRSSSSSSS